VSDKLQDLMILVLLICSGVQAVTIMLIMKRVGFLEKKKVDG